MNPVPRIPNDSKSNPSLLKTPTIPEKSPRKQKIGVDEFVLVQASDKIVNIDSTSKQKIPENSTFKRPDNSVQLFNLKFNEENGLHECISVDINLHVRLSYHGLVISLLEWFQYEKNCTLTKFSMLENFISYLRNKNEDYNKILKEMKEIQHYNSKYSSMMFRFSLLQRYSSRQTYQLLLGQMPLSYLSLLK